MKQIKLILTLTGGILASLAVCADPAPQQTNPNEKEEKRDINLLLKSLGNLENGNGFLVLENSRSGDLKSEIFVRHSESFALSKSALDLVRQQCEVYPFFPFEGYPEQINKSKFPDVAGGITLEYSSGNRLYVTFEKMDSVRVTLTSKEGEKSDLGLYIWPNSEFLTLILQPVSANEFGSRWIVGDDLDTRCTNLEKHLAYIKDLRDRSRKSKARDSGQ